MSEDIREFIVPEGTPLVRVDKYIADQLDSLSRSQLQSAFTDQKVSVNGALIPKRHKVSGGDTISIHLPESKEIKVEPVAHKLDILFEDEHLVVVNKAPGVVVHPGAGTEDNTLVHYLLHHTGGKLSSSGGELRPGVVHRLDKETSGVIVFAKSDKAYFKLIKQFAERELEKEYLALVEGVPQLLSGSIRTAIDRHPKVRVKMCVSEKGREAHTDWAIEEKVAKKYSLIRCFLHTGRTHQIRVHLSSIGHIILGDKLYGFKEEKHAIKIPRVQLHAEKLSLTHPIKGELLTFKAPIPEDLRACMVELAQ